MASYDDTAVVSGSVVSFPNGADDVPTKSLVVTIPPTLSGVSSVTETQTGRNLVDGYVDYSNVNKVVEPQFYKTGTYTFSCVRATNINGIYVRKGSVIDLTAESVSSKYNTLTSTFSVSEDGYYFIQLYRNTSSPTWEDEPVTNVMLEYGSTAHAYEPYQTPTQYTASLGRTIYGGQVDIVNGEEIAQFAYHKITADDDINLYPSADGFRLPTASWASGAMISQANSGGLCNILATVTASTSQGIRFGINNDQIYMVQCYDLFGNTVKDFKTYVTNNDVYVIYRLATPTDFTFDGQEVPTRLGYNAFWSEQGNTELTYYKDGYGFTSVTVTRCGKNLISVPIFTPSTPTLCFDAGKDITVSNITMSFLATNAVVHATNAAIVDYRKEDGTHTYRTLNWFRDANNNQFTANTPQNGKFKNSNSNITFRYIYIYYESITYSMFESDCISEWQIELGSTAHDYEPYEAVTKTAKFHRIVYGGQADVIRGTCEPKNLLKLYLARTSNLGVNFSLTDEGLLHMEGTNISSTGSAFSGGNYSTYDDCPWKFPAGTYTASSIVSADLSKIGSVNLLIRTKSDNVQTVYMLKDASRTFTVNDDFGAWFWASVLKTETVNCDVGVQLEKGSSASDFAPYFDPFTFPPVSMETDEGENTLFANEGASAITYRKETD